MRLTGEFLIVVVVVLAVVVAAAGVWLLKYMKSRNGTPGHDGRGPAGPRPK